MAEDEGFEPPQTESESGVLPLHKSSIALFRTLRHQQHGYYSTERKKVKHYFPFLKDFFRRLQDPQEEKKYASNPIRTFAVVRAWGLDNAREQTPSSRRLSGFESHVELEAGRPGRGVPLGTGMGTRTPTHSTRT